MEAARARQGIQLKAKEEGTGRKQTIKIHDNHLSFFPLPLSLSFSLFSLIQMVL